MKKMFHHKKDDDEVEKPTVGSRPSNTARSDPAIRTSLYEDTMPGSVPQTGDYPVKGSDSSVVQQQQGRKSSIRSLRSRRNSGSQHQKPMVTPYDNVPKTARMTPTPPSNAMGPGTYDPYQQNSGLSQDFSGLNISGGQGQSLGYNPLGSARADHILGPSTVTTTVTTTRFPPNIPPANRRPPQAQGTTNPNVDAGEKALDQDTTRQGPYSNRGTPQTQGYGDQNAGARVNRGTPQTQGYRDQNAGVSASTGSPQTQGYRDQDTRGPYANRASPQTQGYGNRNPGVRTINDSDPQQSPTSKAYWGDLPLSSRSNAYITQDRADDYDDDLARNPSIPRKQVGASAPNTKFSSIQPSSPTDAYTGRTQQPSNPKALPSTPTHDNKNYASNGYGAGRNEATAQTPSVLDRSRPISSKGATGPRSAQDVVNRAKSNTYETEVIEKVAPGKSILEENKYEVRTELRLL